MVNPKWVENDKHGYSNWKTPRLLRFYRESENGALEIPRGYIRQLINLCRRHEAQFQIDDHRRNFTPVDFTFHGKLKPFQEEARNVLLLKDFGTLSAPTGSGKTVMVLWILAQRKQPALIVVHTKELLNQWINRIGTFLGIPSNEVGIIGNGKKVIGEKVTVSLVQSLYKCAVDVSKHIGFLIVDECHRTPSRTFTKAVSAFDSKYMLGLSATPWRRDKLSRLIYFHLGDINHEVSKDALVENGDILEAEVITKETDFRTSLDATTEYSKVLSALTQDTARNRLIAKDVGGEANKGGGISLVLSDRRDHCECASRASDRAIRFRC